MIHAILTTIITVLLVVGAMTLLRSIILMLSVRTLGVIFLIFGLALCIAPLACLYNLWKAVYRLLLALFC